MLFFILCFFISSIAVYGDVTIHVQAFMPQAFSYLSINCVRTNGPTLCPIVWLPYAPEYVDKTPQRGTWLRFVYKCLTSDLWGDLCETSQGQGVIQLYSPQR